MHQFLNDLVYFILVSIIGKKILENWLSDRISASLKWLFVHSTRQAIYYIHYRDHRMKYRNHVSNKAEDCNDDLCRFII